MDETQITNRMGPPQPDISQPYQAMVTTNIVVAQPMTDGSWRFVCVLDDNYNLILNEKTDGNVKKEILNEIRKVKEKWEEKNQVIGLKDLIIMKEENSSQTSEDK